VLEFLEYLQRVRGNTPRTRNARLTAIKSFMHFVEYRVPSGLEQVNRVLAIPNQKTDMRLVDHLTAEQCQAIFDNPAPHTRLAIRDRAMLHVSVTAGLRVSELVGLRLGDVSFESRYLNLTCTAKVVKTGYSHSGGLSQTRCVLGSPCVAKRWRLNYFSMHEAKQ